MNQFLNTKYSEKQFSKGHFQTIIFTFIKKSGKKISKGLEKNSEKIRENVYVCKKYLIWKDLENRFSEDEIFENRSIAVRI